MDIAFIGMGTMGAPMAINLLKAGHRVVVHNRTRDREQVVADAGATRAVSPKAAAMAAELIITCVSEGARCGSCDDWARGGDSWCKGRGDRH